MAIDIHQEREQGGRPSLALPALKGKVTRLVKYAKRAVKVGATNNVPERAKSWANNDWDETEMWTLYRTSSYDNACEVERELITWAEMRMNEESGKKDSWNKVNGGGGLKWGSEAYWVYVLVD